MQICGIIIIFLEKSNNNLIRKPIKEINALNKASLRCFKCLINVSISGKNDLCSRMLGYRREILSVMLQRLHLLKWIKCFVITVDDD